MAAGPAVFKAVWWGTAQQAYSSPAPARAQCETAHRDRGRSHILTRTEKETRDLGPFKDVFPMTQLLPTRCQVLKVVPPPNNAKLKINPLTQGLWETSHVSSVQSTHDARTL